MRLAMDCIGRRAAGSDRRVWHAQAPRQRHAQTATRASLPASRHASSLVTHKLATFPFNDSMSSSDGCVGGHALAGSLRQFSSSLIHRDLIASSLVFISRNFTLKLAASAGATSHRGAGCRKSKDEAAPTKKGNVRFIFPRVGIVTQK